MTTKQEILDLWQKCRFGERIGPRLGERAGSKMTLVDRKIERLKKNGRSTIWRLETAVGDRTVPIILKTFVTSSTNNLTEINLYEKGFPFLQDFLPRIYHIEHNASRSHGQPVTWVFMEQLKPLHGQFRLEPRFYFNHVVPALAKLHGHTFEDRYRRHQDLFSPWFPEYASDSNIKRRQERIASTRKALDAARHDRFHRSLIKPIHSTLDKLLRRGPGFFPELLDGGLSITHGDLHVKNICCADIRDDREWDVQFIDWEGAEFAPVWFDVAQLIEVLIDYRDDWHPQEEALRTRYVALYVSEMNKQGIVFESDPMKLYKMGYLQAMLEKGLYYELHDLLSGRDGVLLDRYFQKLNTWGRDLGLI